MTKLYLILLACCSSGIVNAQVNFSEGPKNGHLIIAGGALRDVTVFDKFIELAGGKGKAHVIIVPTAGGYDITPEITALIQEDWKGYGALKVSVLHTNDPSEANTAAFAKIIDEAGGVYFLGGRQWRLADSYLNTLVHKKLEALLERGGVIAGSSAGATIQGSYLARGDSKTNTVMMGDHEIGMGFLTNAAIDQHTLARNRQFDMFEILLKKPELLGLAIDENTAILVSGNQFEVMGESYVLVYDGTYWDQNTNKYSPLQAGEERFHILGIGDKYDVKERKVVK
jgi:cyanophycinase